MPAAADKCDCFTTYIESSAALLDLVIRPEWMQGVQTNLEISLRFACLLEQFPLPDETEPAPVYEA